MFFDKRAKEVEELLYRQIDQVEKVLIEMEVMLLSYFRDDKQFKAESFEIHQREHKADKIRRKIGYKLYCGAFLPIYREDYYHLVDMIDDIADQAEVIGDFVTLTRPPVPDELKEDFQRLISKNLATFLPLKTMLNAFITGDEELHPLAKEVRHQERDADTLQFYLTRQVFKSNMEKIDKFHLKLLIDKISDVSDLIEDVSDRLEIIGAKHRL